MLIVYEEKRFKPRTLTLIESGNSIIEEYQAQGFSLTLRQLYYQLVARDTIPNKLTEYKRLGSILSKARRAGLVSWSAIEDRTRELRGNSWEDNPEEAVKGLIKTYLIDKWANQPVRPEVWIEKDALTGVIQPTCSKLDVDYFSCRGYSSDSEMWRAGHYRIKYRREHKNQETVIIHLADHDPSGVDMTRDVRERLTMFSGEPVQVIRVALNKNQIREFNPPPNPAKITDSRASAYIKKHGRSSWELDALNPTTLASIIKKEVGKHRNDDLWKVKVEEESSGKERLREMMNS